MLSVRAPQRLDLLQTFYHRVHRDPTRTNDWSAAMLDNEVQQTECQRVCVARIAEEFHPKCGLEREGSERVRVRDRGVFGSLRNGEFEMFGMRLWVSFGD